MYLKEIGLRAPNMITILGSIVNIIEAGGDVYDVYSTNTRIYTFIMIKIFI